MNKPCTVKIPGEYPNVSRTFYREWPTLYHQLKDLHATPVTRQEAMRIATVIAPFITVAFRGTRGRAFRTQRRIVLPSSERPRSDNVPRLRLGLVLHECAHVMQPPGSKPHGFEFCQALAQLVKQYSFMGWLDVAAGSK